MKDLSIKFFILSFYMSENRSIVSQGKNVLDNLNNNRQSKNDESNIKQEYDPNRKFDLFFL